MMKLSDIFDVRYGHSLSLNKMSRSTPENGVPFISRKMGDNGIAAYVKNLPKMPPNPAGELTCALSGNGVLTTHIQERPYYTGFHVACLAPKVELTLSQKLYYCACIKANRYRYGWGRQANRSLKDILLPEPKAIPSWAAEVEANFEGSDAAAGDNPAKDLFSQRWMKFRLADLFDIKKGRRLTKAAMIPGETPFIGAIDRNNGLTSFVHQPPIHPANTITVNYNGNGVAEAFYQTVPYRCSDDVNVLYPKFELNSAVALFINAVIRAEKYRFSYGRKWHMERMERSGIWLPAADNNQPAWDIMEGYIRSLPYSSNLSII